MQRRSLAVLAAVACVGGILAVLTVPVTANVVGPSHSVVVSGLNNRRQLAFGPAGNLLTAEAGRGLLHPGHRIASPDPMARRASGQSDQCLWHRCHLGNTMPSRGELRPVCCPARHPTVAARSGRTACRTGRAGCWPWRRSSRRRCRVRICPPGSAPRWRSRCRPGSWSTGTARSTQHLRLRWCRGRACWPDPAAGSGMAGAFLR
jgi:hypothetical protein